jgi:hypothetical protein
MIMVTFQQIARQILHDHETRAVIRAPQPTSRRAYGTSQD